jgi:uncharacterized membrane protein
MLIIKYITVLTGSMLKFIFGPLSGFALKLSFWETYLLTVVGMMLSVLIFSFLGRFIKEKVYPLFFKSPKKLFTRGNRRKVLVWRKYGLLGIAFLTPLILTPIGGTLVATSFGEHKGKIFSYMLASALVWGALLTGFIYITGDFAFRLFGH